MKIALMENRNQIELISCPVCQLERTGAEIRCGTALPASIANIIQNEYPTWSTHQWVCDSCANQAQATYMQKLLKSKMGELSPLEIAVIESIRADVPLAANTEHIFEQKLTALDHLADGVARVVSSWYFPGAIFVFLVTWIVGNILWRPFEPYPSIVMSVIGAVLASLAALHGPIILMVQKRQQARDRLQAEHDYLVDLKAELEIRYLHEKMDAMLARQAARVLDEPLYDRMKG